MKVLLVTNIPPCRDIATGIVLDRLSRFFPEGTLACFSVADPKISPDLSPCLSKIPYVHYNRPREHWRVFPWWLGSLFTWGMEKYISTFTIPEIVNAAYDFGKNFGADMLWCILDGQTTIRMAVPLAKKLGVPLFTQVWDPPYGTLQAKELDAATTRSVLEDFENALKQSESCASISDPMSKFYNSEYGVDTVTVYPAQEEYYSLPPADSWNEGDCIIGLGGQMYCPEALNSFLSALEFGNWKIAGRNVLLRVTGRKINLSVNNPVNIEFLGWQSHANTVKLMGECDLLYCPCWWTEDQEPQIKFSFPSKLPTFLSAGRPVFFHGPDFAAPADYLRKNAAGFLCHTTEPEKILSALEDALSHLARYRTISENACIAFLRDLTLNSMRNALAKFLKVNADELLDVPEIVPEDLG